MTSKCRAQKNKESWKWSFSREGDVGNFSLLLLTNEGNGNQKPLYMSLIVYPNPTLRHSGLSIVFTLYCTLLSPRLERNSCEPTVTHSSILDSPFHPHFHGFLSLLCVLFSLFHSYLFYVLPVSRFTFCIAVYYFLKNSTAKMKSRLDSFVLPQ